MLDELYLLHDKYTTLKKSSYKRKIFPDSKFESGFIILRGARGVGKTTRILQRLDSYKKREALYIPADHFKVNPYKLYDIAEEFNKYGGKIICFDEIHKYRDWSGELKSIHDSFPDMRLIASGSSTLELQKGSHDLSRRASWESLPGLSFREYLEMSLDVDFPVYSLKEITQSHEEIADTIINIIAHRKKKILPLFLSYLKHGYFPFYFENRTAEKYLQFLEQGVHTTLESDIPAVHSSITGATIMKIKRVLSYISQAAPFTPDVTRLKRILEIGDERTLKTYLKYLEDAGLICYVDQSGSSLGAILKPAKIYLQNSNLMFAILPETNPEKGTIRETFFLNQLSAFHTVTLPQKGDFLIDKKLIFEIGGNSKSFQQINDLPYSYLALDGIERGIGNKIPLWLFGFLY